MGYTNSTLVSHTNLSPNHSGQRTHAIDRITPHCFVGQVTAERAAEVFLPKSRQASCNYAIGKDGRVALVVEEKNRSWCSSSSANDQRAITIECASDSTEPYAFNNAVYERLIELCADICKRNGKSRLLWIEDKQKSLAYEPKAYEMVLTVHRWFANKSCPGAWMYARMGELADRVNAILTAGQTETQQAAAVQQDTGEQSTENIIWAFLSGKGLNDYVVAGIMGNLYAESGLRANNLQNSYNTKLGLTDEEYTAIVDAGKYSREQFTQDKAGYGLAQWTYWSRKQALYDYIKSVGASIGDLSAQLVYLWKELQGYKAVMQQLNSAASVLDASNAILLGYEKPADQSEAVQAKRASYGQKYYDAHAGQNTASTTPAPKPADVPFTVRIEIEDLNIRKGAGTDTAKTGKTTGKGVFTIVEVAQGKGSTAGWGRLKSGAGWVSLDYCTRLK